MGGFWRRLPLNEWGGFGQGSLEVKTPPLSEWGRFKTCPIASWSPAAEDVMVVVEVVAVVPVTVVVQPGWTFDKVEQLCSA